MAEENQKRIVHLIDRMEAGTATQAELEELTNWFESIDFKDVALLNDSDEDYQNAMQESYAAVIKKARVQQQKRIRSIWWAAAIILLLAGSAWVFHVYNSQKTLYLSRVNDIAPGHDGATLILANGKTILLDSLTQGIITEQGNVKVANIDGKLSYNSDNQPFNSSSKLVYNVLSTPRARQYGLVLPDGTKVWLNAESRIRYPTAFTGKERIVELSGEAYFEVVHNENQPFKVKVGNVFVNDIGTHFNICAYNDEPALKTTLLEGAVSVTTGLTTKVLEPGQQAQVTKDNSISMLTLTDPEEAIAWHQGLISLHGTDIASLFRQLSRWYDVDIVYEGSIPRGHLSGIITRNTNLSAVIKMLAANDVQCRIDGKKLIVSP